MNAFDYDSITGEYKGLVDCQESPLEPGQYLIPAHATLIEPPEEMPEKARCFINEEWVYVIDHRGQTAYNIDDSRISKQITELGEISEDYIFIIPPDDKQWYKYNGQDWVLYTPPPKLEDYDKALEDHLKKERIARGYTTREPSDYAGSSVPRWAQDAADWIAHRDEVMLYALEIENHYIETGEGPTLEEFKARLPRIIWTINAQEN